MNKKWIIAIAIIIGILLACGFGIYAYLRGGISDNNMTYTKQLAENEKKNNVIENSYNTIQTANIEVKLSPNAMITEKIYYKDCDHLIRKEKDVPEDLVNATEDKIKEKYAGWKVEKFSANDVVVYKELNGFCEEHFVIKEKDGVIAIYTENSQGVIEWKEDTDIVTKYLPDEDLENLKVGVKVQGLKNLYNYLEDYE